LAEDLKKQTHGSLFIILEKKPGFEMPEI